MWASASLLPSGLTKSMSTRPFPLVERTLSREEAEAGGWFNGPPYGVAEVVLDEHDLPACSLNSE
jgi:hypothetical protein